MKIKRKSPPKFTEEHRKKISESCKNRGVGRWLEKIKISKESREKARQKLLGRKFSEDWKRKISESKKGDKNAMKRPEVRIKISGEKSPLWKGGIAPKNLTIRKSFEMREWRRMIFKRDNYTCVICKQKKRELNADHIKPFSLFPALRFDLENGRTLCVECHRKTPTYGKNLKYYIANNENKITN